MSLGIGATLIVITTLKYNVNAFPGFLNTGYKFLYNRIWFRINPFLFGILVAIIKFEYKHVEKLRYGDVPIHKACLDKIKQERVL